MSEAKIPEPERYQSVFLVGGFLAGSQVVTDENAETYSADVSEDGIGFHATYTIRPFFAKDHDGNLAEFRIGAPQEFSNEEVLAELMKHYRPDPRPRCQPG